MSREKHVRIWPCRLLIVLVDELWRSIVAEIDLCNKDNGGCDHKCLNYGGLIVCQCHEGYRLLGDQRSCEGNDEFIHNSLCPYICYL